MVSKAIRYFLIVAMLLTALPSVVGAQEPIRDLERESDRETEHVILFVAGWQKGDFCLFAPTDDCKSQNFNPVWTWADFKVHLSDPAFWELLHRHQVPFPSYPANGKNSEQISESKIIFYSYTGNYSYIQDASEDQSVDSKLGSCAPYQQFDPPINSNGQPASPDEHGYQCLPDYAEADTGVLLHFVNGKYFHEALYDNAKQAFEDTARLEFLAELILKKFLENPFGVPIPTLDDLAEELITIVSNDVVEKTLTEFGIDDRERPLIEIPQRNLFNDRAQHMQDLISSIVGHFESEGKDVEITIVGHSQGGLIATYWAGWENSDSSHVNAVVTLDSPLGLTLSTYGIKETIVPKIPTLTFELTFSPVSVPYLGQIFPGGTITLIDYPIGEHLWAELVGDNKSLKIFHGLDDAIEAAPTNVPIYTVRNKYDLFVVWDQAWLGERRAWHDKTVYYDSIALNEEFLQEFARVNHWQVTKFRSVSQDLQFVAVSGSIYTPNREDRYIYYTDGTRNQRMDILMASPSFTRGQPDMSDFTVEAVPQDQSRAAYALDVVSVVNDINWSQSSPPNVMAPPLTLNVVMPNDMQPGLYDLKVSYGAFTTATKATTSTAYEAIEVISGADFADTSLVVVIDRSGSMNETLRSGEVKINVVRNAATFLTQLASTDLQNRLGILGFNSGASKVYPTTGPLTEVSSANLNAYLSAISGLSAGGGTAVTGALLTARSWLNEGNTTSRRQAVVILTDGASGDQWNTAQHAPLFAGVPVYTIGFGDSSTSFNEPELKLIATDTGGAYYYAPNESQLRAIYDEIQRQVTGANGIVQLNKSLYPFQAETIEFQVDPTLQQFRLTANWDPNQIGTVGLKLVTPGGTEIDESNVAALLPNSSIFSGNGSWIFTTKSPQPGTWKLVTTGASFAGATGSLRLTSSSDTPLQLEIALSPGSGVVGDPLSTLISLVNFDPTWSVDSIVNAQATVVLPSGRRVPIDLFDDGYHGDGAANDLLFAAVVPGHLTTQVGSYILEVLVDGLLTDGSVLRSEDVTSAAVPFSRIFTTVRQVEVPANTDLTANLASMVVRKPSSATEYCVSYVNHGPGAADNVQLLISADNAIYATADVPATRNMVPGFAFGWQLGQLAPNTAGTIATNIIPLQDNLPVELATWIGSTVPENGTLADVTVDPVGADTINVAVDAGKAHQLDAGWTLFGFNGVQPTVALPTSVLCAADGPIELILGYEKGGVTYSPNVPTQINTLREMSALRGYWIKSDAPRTLAVNGNPVDIDTPIELNQGWNVVNYLPETAQAIDDALSSIAGSYTAVLGYDQGATSFYTAIPPQLSTLQTMEPGNAYWIHMMRPNTLVYHAQPNSPTSASVQQVNQPVRPANVTATNQWVNYFSRSVYLNGQLAPVGTLVEAFTNSGLKVGEARIVEPGMMQLLTAYGDDPTTLQLDGAVSGEKLELRVNGVALHSYDAPAVWSQHGALQELSLSDGTVTNPVYLPLLNN